MKTKEKYYTPYAETGRQTVGQIIQQALARSGLSIRKFSEMVCQSANNPKALDKTTLLRLMKAGQKDGSKGGDFWRLRYIAPFTYWEEKGRAFTEAELNAIATGELLVSFPLPMDIESTDDEAQNNMDEFKIPLGQREMFKLRANIFASMVREGYTNPEDWFFAKDLNPVRPFMRLVTLVEGTGGGGQPLRILEQLARHLYVAECWQGEGEAVQALVSDRQYPSLDALIKAIRNGNAVHSS